MTADPVNLWQTQTAGSPPTAADLRTRAARLRRATRARNYAGFAACAIVLATLAWWLVKVADPLARSGAVLTAAAVVVMIVQLGINVGAELAAARRAADMGATPSLAFHRGELARQRDFHRGRTLWTRLGLFWPGPPLLFAGIARAQPQVAATIGLVAVMFVVFAVLAVPLNLRMARSYQRQLDELAGFERDRS